jgi:hypothetical protein
VGQLLPSNAVLASAYTHSLSCSPLAIGRLALRLRTVRLLTQHSVCRAFHEDGNCWMRLSMLFRRRKYCGTMHTTSVLGHKRSPAWYDQVTFGANLGPGLQLSS